MGTLWPYLQVKGPDGQEVRLELTKTRYTIGRLLDCDLSLPDLSVSRQHCVIEKEAKSSGWYVIDTSRHGTVCHRQGQEFVVKQLPDQRSVIDVGDRIWIGGWEIMFCDPNRTADDVQRLADRLRGLVYKLDQDTFYYYKQGKREKLDEIRPQVKAMLGYMARKNWDNGQQPVLCTYEELIGYLWPGDDRLNRGPQEVNGLAREIRKLLEEYQAADQLETVKRKGYILHFPIACE